MQHVSLNQRIIFLRGNIQGDTIPKSEYVLHVTCTTHNTLLALLNNWVLKVQEKKVKGTHHPHCCDSAPSNDNSFTVSSEHIESIDFPFAKRVLVLLAKFRGPTDVLISLLFKDQ